MEKEGASGKIRILLVEDNSSTCALLRAFFAREEDTYICAEAHDGWEGIEALRRLKPDLILLDLVMPGMDGLQFLRAAAGEEERPKIVVLSGIGADEYIQTALRLGASYYMVKPVDLPQLREQIEILFPHSPPGAPEGESPAERDLARMGADRSVKGFSYAAFAVELFRREGPDVQMKRVYLETAEKFATGYACVEKDIRTLVRRLHRIGDKYYTTVLGFGGREKPPGNGAFLRRMAEEIDKSSGRSS